MEHKQIPKKNILTDYENYHGTYIYFFVLLFACADI